MRSASLPIALLAASIGLALSYADPRVARQSAVILVASTLVVVMVPLAGVSEDIAFVGCWVSMMAAAASVHLPNRYEPWLQRGMALNAGFWAGLVTHVEGGAPAAAIGLPLVLLFLPGRLIVVRSWGIAIKVACSWLIAIAALEIGLNLVPTPGYKPDHMD